MLPMLAEIGKVLSQGSRDTGPCKEVIRRDEFSLLDFPILQCWPKDGGRFITLPCVITRDPKTGKRNVGMYRMQVYDGDDRHALAAAEGGGGTLSRTHARAAARMVSADGVARRVDIMARSRAGRALAEA